MMLQNMMLALFLVMTIGAPAVQAQAPLKGLPQMTPEQAVAHQKMKEKDLLEFFRASNDKEKAELEILKNKAKQRLATISKSGRALSTEEKAETATLQQDLKMMDAGLNPLKMTAKERPSVLKLLGTTKEGDAATAAASKSAPAKAPAKKGKKK